MHNDPLVVSLKPKKIEEAPLPASLPPLPPAPAPARRRRRGGMRGVVFLIILALAAGGWYAATRSSLFSGMFSSDEPSSPSSASSDEAASLIDKVGAHIVLPEGEEPTIATVTDPEKLRDQVFFANAKEGDKVLIYTRARKAYLYDPEMDKLLEVAPLTIESQ